MLFRIVIFIGIFILTLGNSVGYAQGQDESAPQKTGAVVLDGQELFVIRTSIGNTTPEDRARNVIKKLEQLTQDPKFKPISITAVNGEISSDVIADNIIITSVTDVDAQAVKRNRMELANDYAEKLRSSLRTHKAHRTLTTVFKALLPWNILKTFVQFLLKPMIIKSVIVIAGILAIAVITKVTNRLLAHHMTDPPKRYNAQKTTIFIACIASFIFAILVFKDIPANLTIVLSVATAGITFALKEVIVSIAGWIGTIFGSLYKVGDRVQLGGIKGDVIDVGFVRTTLMELGEWVKADLYTGRIVRVPNSVAFSEPLFNYSGEFPYLWDEITLPIKYGCDQKLAKDVLQRVINEVAGKYIEDAESHWQKFSKKYLVEPTITSPMVTLILNDNWMEFTIRYLVDYRERRILKDSLFHRIMEEVDKSNGKLALASATFQLVQAPVIDVKVHN